MTQVVLYLQHVLLSQGEAHQTQVPVNIIDIFKILSNINTTMGNIITRYHTCMYHYMY